MRINGRRRSRRLIRRAALIAATCSVLSGVQAPAAQAAGGSAALTVNAWSVDTSTGKVTYSLSVSGDGECTSGCGIAIDLGRADAAGVTQRVGGLSVSYTSQSTVNGFWSAAGTSAGDRVTLTETTAVRAVYKDPSGTYPGAWQTVSAPYPAAAASVQAASWSADTGTGAITYDVTGSAATLAKAGGPCENVWCSMKVEAGRLDSTSQVAIITTLGCTGGGSVHNTWTMTVRCTATAKTMPEVTRVRAVVTGAFAVASDWLPVHDAYPAPTATLPSITWTPNTTNGQVTYDVTGKAIGLAKAGGPCENAWCAMKVEAGRVTSSGAVAVLTTIGCTGGGSAHNTWTMAVRCVATAKTLPEVTRLRTVVTGKHTLTSAWYVVSPSYPDPTVAITAATWSADTATGQVTYDVTATGSTLAKAGGPCENFWCTMKVEAGRLNSTGGVSVVATLSCSGGGSVHNAWTITVRCVATGATMAEITRIRPVITGATTLAGTWYVVSDAYPEPAVTLPSVSWVADTATGKVTYDVTGRATSLAKAGGPCENVWCSMKVEAGRLTATGQVAVVATLSCTGGASSHNTWTMNVACVASGVTMPEITRIRPVVTGAYVAAGAWHVVSEAYPDPEVALNVGSWAVATDTGQITYDVTGTATALAQAGGPCENVWCSMKVEAARRNADGVVMVVADLACTGGGSVQNAWKIVVRCTATGVTMPEITMIRPVVGGSTTFTGDWVTVSPAYPEPVVTLGPVTWTPDMASGEVTYDVTGTAVTLAKAAGPCENVWCSMTIEAARVHRGQLETVGSLACTGGGSVHNAWKIVVRCAATASTMREVTRIRAVVTGATPVTSEWFVVSAPYTDPVASLTVNTWDFTGEVGNGAGYFETDIRGMADGLARAGGPCETSWCSISFEGGLPDVYGVIRARSRLTADGTSSISPGTWRAAITRIDDHTMVPDQLYLRVGVYQDGHLVLATAWQERSSVAVAGAAGGFEAAFLAGAAPLLLERSMQDPCIEAFGSAEAPRTQNSSLNDWQWTCETARAAGMSRWQQFAEVARKYGKYAVVTGGAAVAAAIGIAAPSGDPITALEEDPAFLRSVDRLLRRLSYRDTLVEPDRRKTAVQVITKCRDLGLVGGGADCDELPIYIPGNDVPVVAGHAERAIAEGQPRVLTYAHEDERRAAGVSRDWYNRVQYSSICPSPRPEDTACDEYPYYSTTTSGPGSSLQLLGLRENSQEGSLRRVFWSTCGISSAPPGSPDRAFLVLPMPETVPTMGFCKP